MINKDQVIRRFSKMSSSYDQYAVVQKHMAHSLIRRLEPLSHVQSILEIGCGTGFFTRLLAEKYPHASIVASDISPGMLSAARCNLTGFANISYQIADGENLNLCRKFDLIVSNAAFQWFNDYHQAFTGLYNHLNPEGHLLYATFGSNTFHELHASFKAARKMLNITTENRSGQQFPTLEFLNDNMQQIGFQATLSEEIYKEGFPCVKDFLVAVKKIGANNARFGRDTMVSRPLMLNMMRYYAECFGDSNQIYATYHNIYGHGQKRAKT